MSGATPLNAPSLEEKLHVDEGMGIVRLEIREPSPLASRPLAEPRLKGRRIQFLPINRGGREIAVPGGLHVLQPGDVVICCGDVEAARELFPVSAAISPEN